MGILRWRSKSGIRVIVQGGNVQLCAHGSKADIPQYGDGLNEQSKVSGYRVDNVPKVMNTALNELGFHSVGEKTILDRLLTISRRAICRVPATTIGRLCAELERKEVLVPDYAILRQRWKAIYDEEVKGVNADSLHVRGSARALILTITESCSVNVKDAIWYLNNVDHNSKDSLVSRDQFVDLVHLIVRNSASKGHPFSESKVTDTLRAWYTIATWWKEAFHSGLSRWLPFDIIVATSCGGSARIPHHALRSTDEAIEAINKALVEAFCEELSNETIFDLILEECGGSVPLYVSQKIIANSLQAAVDEDILRFGIAAVTQHTRLEFDKLADKDSLCIYGSAAALFHKITNQVGNKTTLHEAIAELLASSEKEKTVVNFAEFSQALANVLGKETKRRKMTATISFNVIGRKVTLLAVLFVGWLLAIVLLL